MKTPELLLQLTDPLKQAIAWKIWDQFLYETARRRSFMEQRMQPELRKIEEVDRWEDSLWTSSIGSLLDQLEEDYTPYGLPVDFYRHKFEESGKEALLWEKFLADWRQAISTKLEVLLEKETQEKRVHTLEYIQRALVEIPKYLGKDGFIRTDEFLQVWGTMSGRWNTVDYERMREVVRIQENYPILLKVARKMGRTAEEDSRERLSVASGFLDKMEHASRSDIQGITTGSDLNSLLPAELAQSADETLSDVFLYHYVTHRLQTFSHQSRVLKPLRTLQLKPARQQGPMIVCLDTSGSMSGQPERIAQSMLVKLLQLADEQDRALYLIAFSVSIHPIDVRRERARLREFFTKTASGDTDATQMVQTLLRLLDEQPEYRSADVLWITDFKMNRVAQGLLDRMQQHRSAGTQFIGLRMGLASEPVWEPYFDEIDEVPLPHFRKYGK